MERTKRIMKGTGKVMLALLGGVLMPILIWVALGVALNQRLRERRAVPKPAQAPTIGEILAAAGLSIQGEAAPDEMVASKVLAQRTVPEITQLLARAGLTIQEQSTFTHCWEILHCPPEKRAACPAYIHREVPSWVAIGLGRGKVISEVCVNQTFVDLRRLPVRA